MNFMKHKLNKYATFYNVTLLKNFMKKYHLSKRKFAIFCDIPLGVLSEILQNNWVHISYIHEIAHKINVNVLDLIDFNGTIFDC